MDEKDHTYQVPAALKNWFVIHFIIDMAFALPLMIVPTEMLTLFGWQTIDPITARVAAAALFGIGIESLLGRHASRDTFRHMLTLKIIWSSAVIFGSLLSLVQGVQVTSFFIWLIVGVFAGFNLLWVYWYRQLSKHP